VTVVSEKIEKMARPKVDDEAFVTLTTNDTYSLGCLVLGNSLRRAETNRVLVVMVTDGVSSSMREQLSRVFDLIVRVDVLDSRDSQKLDLLTRPDLGVTFTKLHCWRLTQFKKCVFLDADTMVLQNVDELFERKELSGAPDAGWPDCFNSGVFVYEPSEETYSSLVEFAVKQGSFDGGDQGLLNLYFSDWSTKDISRHLPFVYNVVSQAFYSYLPAFKQFHDKIRIVHFIGAIKPWNHKYNTQTGEVEIQEEAGHSAEFLKLWWAIFLSKVQPYLDPQQTIYEKGGLIGQLAALSINKTPEPYPGYSGPTPGSREHQYAWECGQIDYRGIDAFSNIQQHLDATINGSQPVNKTVEAPTPAEAVKEPVKEAAKVNEVAKVKEAPKKK
ncbi:unnamed protein product, partial [Owenia fusiformis]